MHPPAQKPVLAHNKHGKAVGSRKMETLMAAFSYSTPALVITPDLVPLCRIYGNKGHFPSRTALFGLRHPKPIAMGTSMSSDRVTGEPWLMTSSLPDMGDADENSRRTNSRGQQPQLLSTSGSKFIDVNPRSFDRQTLTNSHVQCFARR